MYQVDLNLLVGVMTFTFSPLHCFYATIAEGGAADRRRRPILVFDTLTSCRLGYLPLFFGFSKYPVRGKPALPSATRPSRGHATEPRLPHTAALRQPSVCPAKGGAPPPNSESGGRRKGALPGTSCLIPSGWPWTVRNGILGGTI